jgi:hypothetical protein
MIAIATEWIFGWPTNTMLIYAGVAWFIFMSITSLYVWYLETKQD